MPEKENVWTIVVAAGSGLRFGSAKQFERLGGKRVVEIEQLPQIARNELASAPAKPGASQ